MSDEPLIRVEGITELVGDERKNPATPASGAFCGSCGQPMPAGQVFCGSCGARTVPAPADQTTGTVAAPVGTYNTETGFEQTSAAVPTNAIREGGRMAATSSATPWRTLGIAGVIALIIGVLAAFMWPSNASALVADGQIGPNGGVIPMTDGGKIQAPAGAVNTPERIIVKKTVIRERVQTTNPLGGVLVYNPGDLPVYFFYPPTLAFLQPVLVILPLPVGAVAGRIYVIRNGRLVLLAVQANQGGFVRLSVTGFSGGLLVVR